MKSVASGRSPGAQTVHRALDVLEVVANAGVSATLAVIADETGLARATAHRVCRTLLDRGYLRQLGDRSYALGFRLVPLGNAANRVVGADAHEVLKGLVEQLGETANLAILVGHQAEYVAQVPSRYTMRTFTEVGRRVDLHTTGVGKALLAQLDHASVKTLARQFAYSALTPYTITSAAALFDDLEAIRARGYALDEQEQELGVRCVAVAVPMSAPPGLALSISGPMTRLDDEVVTRAVALLKAGAAELACQIAPGM